MSRHRFEHNVDRSDDTKDVSAPARPQRIEVITGVERRRKWSAQEKAAIVAESLAEGAVVSEVARRHGLNPQQLFGWRARLRDAVNCSAVLRRCAKKPAMRVRAARARACSP